MEDFCIFEEDKLSMKDKKEDNFNKILVEESTVI